MSLIRLLSHRLPLPLSRLPRSFPSITRSTTCSCIRTFATTSKSTSTSTSTSTDDAKKNDSNPATSTSKDDNDDVDAKDIDDVDEVDDVDDVDEDEDNISTHDMDDDMDEDDDDIHTRTNNDDDDTIEINDDEIIIKPTKKDTLKSDKSSKKTDKSSQKMEKKDDDDDDDEFEHEYDELEQSANTIKEKYTLPRDILSTVRPSSRPGYVIIRTMMAEELQDVEIKESDLKDERTLEHALDLKELEILEKEFPDNEKDYAEELRIEAEKKDVTKEEEMPMLRMEQARLNALIVEEELQDSPNMEYIADLTHRLEFIQSRILLWEGGYFDDPTEEEIKDVKDAMREEAQDKIAAAREAQAAAIQKYSQNIKPEVIKKLAAEHPEAYPLAAALANNEIIQWYTEKEEKHMIRHRPRTKLSTTYEPVPEDIPAITAFLKSIKLEKHVDKFPSWWALMSMKSLRMKKANIGCQDRKKILKAVENHKRSRYREYLAQHIQNQITQQKSEYDAYAAARKQEIDAQKQQTRAIRRQQHEAWEKQQPLHEQVQQVIAAQRKKEMETTIETQIQKLEQMATTISSSSTTTTPIVPKTPSRDRSYEKTW